MNEYKETIRVRAYLTPFFACTAMLGLLLVGCSNPTADKTAAIVTESPTTESVEGGPETTAAPEPIEGTVYRFTHEDSSLDFEGYKVSGAHVGGFAAFTGEIIVPDAGIESGRITINIDATSLYSDNPMLTDKLKSADFFDVETCPEAKFVSSAIEKSADGYNVTGDLTLHGITKRVTFPASIEVSPDTVTADAEFTIKRFDWDINYKGLADDLIREDVLIYFEIIATSAGDA